MPWVAEKGLWTLPVRQPKQAISNDVWSGILEKREHLWTLGEIDGRSGGEV